MNFKEWILQSESVDVYRHRQYTPGMVRLDVPWQLPSPIDQHVKHAATGVASAVHGTFDNIMQKTGAPTPTYQHFTREGPRQNGSNDKVFTTTIDKTSGINNDQMYQQALEKIVSSDDFKLASRYSNLDPKFAKVMKKLDGGNNVSYKIKFFDPSELNVV